MPAPATRMPSSLQVDYSFSAPDFDVKDWINNALGSLPKKPVSDIPTSTSNDASTDASLDASLTLLQTPAHDPVLAERDLDDLLDNNDTLSKSTPPSSSGSTSSSVPAAQIQPSSKASSTTATALTQHATTHLTKLHLLASQISTNLNNTTMDVVKLLPRLSHELDQLRQETRLLQEGIQLVRGDVAQVEPTETVSALDRLKYLDLIKTRMEATHAALREAENWRNLEAEAQEIFAKGDFTRAATRLAEAERSLVVYKNTNVEEDRMALLQVLKDQLEQQVMERTKTALQQRDTAGCQSLISVFGLIGRQERFQECYFSQRRGPLLDVWKKQLTTSTSLPKEQFITFLQTFYSDASTMLNEEFAWGNSIFTDPSASIHGLVRNIFSHLDPSFASALQQIASPLGDEGKLSFIISAFTATIAFGARMERVVSQPLVGNQREPTSARTGVPPGRRSRSGTLIGEDDNARAAAALLSGGTSKPFSTTSLAELSSQSRLDPNEWAYVLYEPFMPYQRDYGRLEAAHLRALLIQSVPSMEQLQMGAIQQKIQSVKHCSNLVKIMTATNNFAFSLAEGAIGRCIKLTHGFGAAGLTEGLNEFFSEILDCYKRMLIFYRHKSGLLLDGEKPDPIVAQASHLAAPPSGALTTRQTSRSGGQHTDASDGDDDNDDSDGWDDDDDGMLDDQGSPRLFQMGLRMMVLCRQFCQRLQQLDLKTKQALVGVDVLLEMGHERTEDKASESQQSLPPLASAAAAAAVAHSQAALAESLGSSGRTTRAHRLSIVEPRDHAAALAASVSGNPLHRLPQASVALLQQSNLNSFRLAEILAIVKRAQEAGELSVGGITTKDGKANNTSSKSKNDLECSADHLYRPSYERAVELTRLCQRFIFDSMYIPLVRPLAGVAALPCWTEGLDLATGKDTSSSTAAAAQGASSNAGGRRIHSSTLGGTRTDVYRFRSGPSDYIEEVWRRLDALLKFGVYAGDDGLRFGIQALPYADRSIEGGEGDDGDGQDTTGHRVGEASSAENISGSQEQGAGNSGEDLKAEEKEEEQVAEEDDDSDEAVFHRWMTSLARATMHTLIDRLYDPERAGSTAALARALQAANNNSNGSKTNSPSMDYRARMASQNQLPSRTGSPAIRESLEMQRSQSPAPTSGSSSLPSQQQPGLVRLSEAGVKQLETDLVFLMTESLPSLGIDPTPNVQALRRALGMSKADLLRTIEQMESELDKFLESQKKKKREKMGLDVGDELKDEEDKDKGVKETTASTTTTAAAAAKKETGQEVSGATSPADTFSSAFVPGIPALPSTFTATEDDVEAYLKQEKAIHEWVAKLRGLTVR
ncbi:hypothetical protein BGW41_001179 [Actinomortierella wolfii]|nr:hypothetical protein BGW41_001179 [Actinomortierella wolfii]